MNRGFISKITKNNKAVAAALIFLIAVVAISALAELLPLMDPNEGSLSSSLCPPSIFAYKDSRHLLGTDLYGRDICTLIIYGARTSLGIAFIATLLSMGLGVLLGLLAGYFAFLDQIIMRIVDIQLSFPAVVLAIALVSALGGPSITNLVIVLAIRGWIQFARVVRSQVLSLKESVLIEAVESLGATRWRTIFVHMLPNVVSSSVAIATVYLPMVMIQEAGLSFLGLGVPIHIPSWGMMLREGQQMIYTAWWPIVFPTLAVTSVVFAGVIVGDWLTRLYEKV